MPVTHITDGNPESKRLDCFRAAQRLRSPMAGRPALRGHSDPFENLGISRGHSTINYSPPFSTLAEGIGRFFFLFLSLSTRNPLNNGSRQVSNHFAASK